MPTHENYIKQFVVQWKEDPLVKDIDHMDGNGNISTKVILRKDLEAVTVPQPEPPYKEYVEHESGVTRVVTKEQK